MLVVGRLDTSRRKGSRVGTLLQVSELVNQWYLLSDVLSTLGRLFLFQFFSVDFHEVSPLFSTFKTGLPGAHSCFTSILAHKLVQLVACASVATHSNDPIGPILPRVVTLVPLLKVIPFLLKLLFLPYLQI